MKEVQSTCILIRFNKPYAIENVITGLNRLCTIFFFVKKINHITWWKHMSFNFSIRKRCVNVANTHWVVSSRWVSLHSELVSKKKLTRTSKTFSAITPNPGPDHMIGRNSFTIFGKSTVSMWLYDDIVTSNSPNPCSTTAAAIFNSTSVSDLLFPVKVVETWRVHFYND